MYFLCYFSLQFPILITLEKPFIELTCIQGEYNPMKLFHEEVNEHGTQILTFGRD